MNHVVPVDPVPSFKEAKERFMAGLCPDCGGKMEYRRQKRDFFCYRKRCRRNWTFLKVEEEFGAKPTVVQNKGHKGHFSNIFSRLFRKPPK